MTERYLLSYSTKGFYNRHDELNKSAKKFGIKKHIDFYDRDLFKTDFYRKNKIVLDNPKGAGFWLWKPYYINEALKQINDGDLLFYVDAASVFIDDPEAIFKIAGESEQGIIPFDTRPLTNRQFCRRDAFINLGCDTEKYWNSWHVIATMIVIKKTVFAVSFISEWLQACQNPFSIVNNNNSVDFKTKNEELLGFIDHRSDQSIFSILVAKHNLETYRNPCIWGNYLKMKTFRKEDEFAGYPFHLENSIKSYSDTAMENSPYGTIFQINRGRDEIKKINKRFFLNHYGKFKNNRMLKNGLLKIFNKFGYHLTKKNISDTYVHKSYSQCGEDLIINHIFSLRGIVKPTYIDIGANHPYYLSNSASFYERGCRGINIDANPNLIQLFNSERPDDINLNIGISDKDDELDFYMMEDNTLSTFSKSDRDFMIESGKPLSEVKKVKLTTIKKILEQYCNNIFPDFMSLDVEGLDFEILQSIDFNISSPKIICVEAAEYSPIGAGVRRSDLINFLVDKGYYEYANTNLNAIMVKNEFWFI